MLAGGWGGVGVVGGSERVGVLECCRVMSWVRRGPDVGGVGVGVGVGVDGRAVWVTVSGCGLVSGGGGGCGWASVGGFVGVVD
jgi:hypothetical protein